MPIENSWPVVKQVLSKLRTEKEAAEVKAVDLQKQLDAKLAAEAEIDQVAADNAAYVAGSGAHVAQPSASTAPNLIDRLS